MSRVLHVTESLGGGVATALAAFAKNSPESEHHLFASVRPSAAVEMDLAQYFRSVTFLKSGWIGGSLKLWKHFRLIRPDYVHLHSSFAGAFGRLIPLPRSRIIYTPHCFGFEREDLSGMARSFFRYCERILSIRAHTLAAISPREAQLGREMHFKCVIYVPNSSLSVRRSCRTIITGAAQPLRVIGVGRLCAQKGSDFFAALARKTLAHDRRVQFKWIGDGDPDMKMRLQASGVEVAGWLSHAETLASLAESHVYLHTAAWEGAPISVIEAATVGTPILARDIPSLRSLGTPNLLAAPEEFAKRLMDFCEYPSLLEAESQRSLDFSAQFSAESQRTALTNLYRARA